MLFGMVTIKLQLEQTFKNFKILQDPPSMHLEEALCIIYLSGICMYTFVFRNFRPYKFFSHYLSWHKNANVYVYLQVIKLKYLDDIHMNTFHKY